MLAVKKKRLKGLKDLSPIARVVIHILLIGGAIWMIGPFIWMILTSLKTFGESTQVPLVIFPNKLQWVNYINIVKEIPFLNFYQNTIVSTLFITLAQLLFCSMAAYAFARIKFPGRDFLFILSLSVLMVPRQVFLIPQYLIIARLGWLNSLKALITPAMFSAFGMFLLRQFFKTLPKELEESAKLDGCNQFQIYWRIMLPLTKPGLIALMIFTIRWSWNSLMWPLIVNTSPDKLTLAAGLASLQGQYGTNYPVLMAGSLLAILPIIIMFIILQQQFIEGIALTGTKG